jgi:predicted nucleic acid-binding protein
VYLDTSALVKLYVVEVGSEDVIDAVSGARLVATSAIAYVEAIAAFARRRRERALKPSEYRLVRRALDRDWERFVRLAVSEALIHSAAAVAERYRLRAYDSLHLASAMLLQENLHEPVSFLCWDTRLASAAARAGLRVGRDRT